MKIGKQQNKKRYTLTVQEYIPFRLANTEPKLEIPRRQYPILTEAKFVTNHNFV